VAVRLLDEAQPANNRLTVCNQGTYQVGPVEKRFDVVFLVNGLPLVINRRLVLGNSLPPIYCS
jgi:type I restriction enzyme R subunit